MFSKTIVETKEERLARGHPVGQDVPYAAMGGITGFSSLMDGYMRLDDSGIGPPPLDMLEQPIGTGRSRETTHYWASMGRLCCMVHIVYCDNVGLGYFSLVTKS